jgi:FkbM family methyltransferase
MSLRRWMESIRDRLFIQKPGMRRSITRLIEGDRDVDVLLFGREFRINTVKEHGYLRASRLSGKASLLRDETAVLINLAGLLSDHDTFLDIGANIGIYSVLLARLKRLQPGLSFLAYEANPDTFARLKVNTEKFNINAVNLAISDRNGTLEFVGGAVSHVFTTVEHATPYSIMNETSEVECRRLDHLDIPGNSIVMKIDVEGQELEVLRGSAGLFEAGRVKAVYIDGYADQKVPAVLAAHGFTLLDGRSLEPYDGLGHCLLGLREPRTSSGRFHGIDAAT